MELWFGVCAVSVLWYLDARVREGGFDSGLGGNVQFPEPLHVDSWAIYHLYWRAFHAQFHAIICKHCS